jgi:hypothetical protein
MFGSLQLHAMAALYTLHICVCLFNRLYRLCGLVVRVSGYRSRDKGSIPGAARFSEK